MIRIVLFCLIFSVVHAQEYFNKTESFQRAHIGICIVDMKTGKEVYSFNAHQYFVPASLQKVITSVVAVDLLGPDFCFKTDFGIDGEVDEKGNLQGNVWVQGGGDPTLSLDIFEQWREALKKQGIQKIKGKLLVDASCFESALASPYWYFQDLGNYYGAGASGLSINQNLYHVTFQPGLKEGDPATILKIEPTIPNLLVQNEVTTGPPGSGDQVYIFGSEYSPLQFYRGTVPIDQPFFTVKGAIPDPPSFCAVTLCKQLKIEKGYEMARLEKGGEILMSAHSIPLREMLKETNKESINLYAEHLLKVMGEGTAQKGTLKIAEYLKNLGIPAEVRDGSGLARNNYLTPKGFVSLLYHIKKMPQLRCVYESFPELGKEGTLYQFKKVSKATVKAKTGSMTGIYNLGGYLTLESGKEYAFCVICNNYQGPLKEIKGEMHRFLTEFVEKLCLEH